MEPQAEKPQTVPLSTIAKLLVISERRVQQLAKDGIIPEPESRGEYELIGCVQGYVRFLQEQVGQGTAGSPEMVESKLRMAKAKTEEQELKVLKMRGELVRLDEMLNALISILTLFKTTMRAIPSKVAPRCRMAKTDGQTQALLHEEIDAALNALARAIVELKNSVDGQSQFADFNRKVADCGSPSSEPHG